MTTSTIPVISKPCLDTLGLFQLTSVVLLYRKNFRRLKISEGFIFGHLICPKLTPSEIFANNIDAKVNRNLVVKW